MAWFYYGSTITDSEPINFSVEYTQDNKDNWPEVIFYEENNKKYAKAGIDLNSVQELTSFLQKAGYKTITEEKPKDTSDERYVWGGKSWLGQSITGVSGIIPDNPGYTANADQQGVENSSTRGEGLGINPNG